MEKFINYLNEFENKSIFEENLKNLSVYKDQNFKNKFRIISDKYNLTNDYLNLSSFNHIDSVIEFLSDENDNNFLYKKKQNKIYLRNSFFETAFINSFNYNNIFQIKLCYILEKKYFTIQLQDIESSDILDLDKINFDHFKIDKFDLEEKIDLNLNLLKKIVLENNYFLKQNIFNKFDFFKNLNKKIFNYEFEHFVNNLKTNFNNEKKWVKIS